MRQTIIIITFCLIAITLQAEKAGTLHFIMGKVMYKANTNTAYVPAEINQAISREGWLKTELDSEAEILWTDNTTSTVQANQQISINTLITQAHKSGSWSNNLQQKVSALSLQNKQKATSVAGVRRDEVELKAESELYWDMEPLESIDDAISLFQQEKYSNAAKAFQKVVEQAPLRKEAETSHGYLILCYEKLGDKKNLELQIQKLRADFPNSPLLESLSEYK